MERLIRLLWPKEQEATALAVFTAESGLRCEAVGDSHLTFKKAGEEYGKSYSVAQIRSLPGRPAASKLQDCAYNIYYAYKLWEAQSWKPWSAWKSGAFKQHLARF